MHIYIHNNIYIQSQVQVGKIAIIFLTLFYEVLKRQFGRIEYHKEAHFYNKKPTLQNANTHKSPTPGLSSQNMPGRREGQNIWKSYCAFTNPRGETASTEQNVSRGCDHHKRITAAIDLIETLLVPGTPVC